MTLLEIMPNRAADLLSLLETITIIPDGSDIEALIESSGESKQARVLSFVNQHAFNLAWTDKAFSEELRRADYLLRDGVGLEILLSLIGIQPGKNCNGTDIIPHLLEQRKGKSIALFGTREPWTSAAAAKIEEMGLKVCATLNGFEEEQRYIDLAKDAKPDIILLAMGMPRQEQLAGRLRESLECGLIINGGAILDFLAERFPRAPRWVQSSRLEWLFRLALEPRRLARRYLSGGAVFAFRGLLVKQHALTRQTQ
ncbi:WecB/TagA/CpsF family glycosyltransferase [Bosea sp. BH3]|uniref:WecB/TagA/CpsF family glycosyltransferase n=1 Tax=Bosea sp. BH3 TaxID=2871701 RepID=UPI0021CB93B6|nr:WecB/TagA/CpsF family glycosyltransferase [Bosea sp. BH3]MCU4181149.1 WecB/TagA/CpsF family glycosyltransferase [Bosea sp. BH3]